MVGDKPKYELHFHTSVQGTVINDYNKVKHLIQDRLTPLTSVPLHQLPPDIVDFTGRQAELESVTTLLRQVNKSGEIAPTISVLTGMAGVGKSALAIHVAYQLQPDFPDAQLYINLRGTESQPLEPSQVLAGWLRALGVEALSIPETLADRSNLYRSLLSGKQALIVLDNAHDETQVRPLLPNNSTCAAIVTTRQPLAEIEKTATLELDVMTEQEALELLQSLIGVERTQAALDAATTIIDLCSRLPLALRITGGTLKNQPDWRLEDCAIQLTDERERLLSLRLSDLAVRVSLALGYQKLNANSARLFRLLGLLTGPTFTPALATALLESEPATAQEAVKRLVDVQLLEPASQGCDREAEPSVHRFHDLVRLFARGQLAQEEPSEARQAARLRISRWYVDTSQIIDLALHPETRCQLAQVLRADKNQSLKVTEQNLFLAALHWFEREQTNLMASIKWAHEAHEWEIVASIAHNLVNFFQTYAYWTDWEQTHLLALETIPLLEYLPNDDFSSTNIASRHAKAQILSNLANFYYIQNNWFKARDCYEQSLRIFREIGEQLAVAKVLGNLANVYYQQSDWGKASDYYKQSLNVFGELKDNYGEGQTLANLGILAAQQNNEEKAMALWQEALEKLPSNSPKSEQIAEWLPSNRQLPVEVAEAPIELHQAQDSIIKIAGGVIVVIVITLFLIFIIF